MYTCAKCNILACGSQDPAVRENAKKLSYAGTRENEQCL